MPVPFLIDRRLATPLHRQIYEQWREGILAGRFRRRARVPSTRAFAAAYGVSRATATAAYEQLLAEGYFETTVGAGTFVCSELPDDARRAAGRAPVARRATPARVSRFAARLDVDPRVPPATGRLNLSNLGPDVSLFPFSLWRRVLTRHLRRLTAPDLDH